MYTKQGNVHRLSKILGLTAAWHYCIPGKPCCAHVAGFRLEQPAFIELVKAFDPERKGQVTYAPYIAMTLFLRSAANAFQAFDPQRTGRVSLDFSQFIYANANCR